jgi:hypothetical protein
MSRARRTESWELYGFALRRAKSLQFCMGLLVRYLQKARRRAAHVPVPERSSKQSCRDLGPEFESPVLHSFACSKLHARVNHDLSETNKVLQ